MPAPHRPTLPAIRTTALFLVRSTPILARRSCSDVGGAPSPRVALRGTRPATQSSSQKK
jgi:hypothetical protein